MADIKEHGEGCTCGCQDGQEEEMNITLEFDDGEKVEVAPPADNGGVQKTSGPAKLSDQYAYDVWYDMGDYAFILKHEMDLNMDHLESDATVAAALQARYPDYQILQTFFSPSSSVAFPRGPTKS